MKILAILTNCEELGPSGEKTGLWASELTHFRDAALAAGHTVDLASPKGGRVPLDPRSLKGAALDTASRAQLPELEALLLDTMPLPDVRAEGYDAVFFAGGHGTMGDFKDNADIERISREVYERGGVVSAVCHGVAALVSAHTEDGTSLIEGRAVTGFSNTEERLSGKHALVPYLLEDELRKRTDLYSTGWLPFIPYAVADGRIVTGQNPQSTRAVAHLVLELLAQEERTNAGVPRINLKCRPCLFGTWIAGLSAVAWGVMSFVGILDPGWFAALVLAGVGTAFLWYQHPFGPCMRCVGVFRTRSTTGR